MNDTLKNVIGIVFIVVITIAVVNLSNGDKPLGGYESTHIFDVPGIVNSSVDIDVTASSTTILLRNDNRKYAQICNASSTDDTNNTWIWFNTSTDSVAVDNGFTLAAGSCYEIDSSNLYIGPVYGIATAIDVTLSVLEQ